MALALMLNKIRTVFEPNKSSGSKIKFGDNFGRLSEKVTAPDIAVIHPAKYLKTMIFPLPS
jgi:hypothetical protein